MATLEWVGGAREPRQFLGLAHRFWRTHALLPAAGFLLAIALITGLDLDRAIAHALFFDAATNHWRGDAGGSWWAAELIHRSGRWVAGIFILAAFGSWVASFISSRARPWRRSAGFALVALLLSTGIVDGLKAVTNVDCPWDLSEFGGDRPYVQLLADRPDSLPRGRCFPGAHACSGFALLFGYFLLRDRSRGLALGALAGAILMGILFSVVQESRGAHFISHDLTSAGIVWFVQLALYTWLLATKRCLAGRVTSSASSKEVTRSMPV
jgi:membrane-associated PAP2 superfamily phosphatase